MGKLIALGADHGGFALKEKLKDYLKRKNIGFVDLGNTELDMADDYPDYALKVAQYAVKHDTLGILICRTGIGTSMAANKVHGARTAVVNNPKEAQVTRQHNNANVLCIAGTMNPSVASKSVNAFINEKFRAGRHARRLRKIRMIEQLQKHQ